MKTKTIYFVLGVFCAVIYMACMTSNTAVIKAQSITSVKLSKLRQNLTNEIAKTTTHRGYTKSQINKVFNALEDWYNTNPGNYTGGGKSQMNSVVVDSSAITFTGAQKKILIAFWLENKIDEELGR